MGLSSADGARPIDSELFISATKAQALHQPFCDGRSIVAKRYRVAQSQTKPHLGFLKEQSNHYAAYVASIYLAAMRFCMLVIVKSWHPSSGIADMRQQLAANATAIDYATRL